MDESSTTFRERRFLIAQLYERISRNCSHVQRIPLNSSTNSFCINRVFYSPVDLNTERSNLSEPVTHQKCSMYKTGGKLEEGVEIHNVRKNSHETVRLTKTAKQHKKWLHENTTSFPPPKQTVRVITEQTGQAERVQNVKQRVQNQRKNSHETFPVTERAKRHKTFTKTQPIPFLPSRQSELDNSTGSRPTYGSWCKECLAVQNSDCWPCAANQLAKGKVVAGRMQAPGS